MVAENLQNQPDATFLDLQDQEIEDLDVIMDQLEKFELLEELNLSNNQFSTLPEDMSPLKNIANLNFQNIVFDDFEKAVKSIATVPVLRSLYINLESEDQVDMLMRYLPELEYLNGLPVERDALDESLHSQQDLKNAVLAEAEAHGTAQITEQAEAEDESIADYTNINQTQGEANTSLMSAQSATRNANILAQYLDTEELEQMAMCFDNIRQMRSLNGDMADNDDTALGDQFDECLSGMISDLTDNLKQLESSQEKTRAVISGKRDLMQLLVEKTLEYHRTVDP